ncbi:MAG: signal peptidase II [Hyphomicrobiaceae bacterium]
MRVSNARPALVASAATVVIDQASKAWALGLALAPGERIQIAPFMDIVMTFNPGISYGLLALEGRNGQLTLAGVSIVIAAGLTAWLWLEQHSRLAALGLALIIGGAIGNAIDRLYLPGVADFVLLHAYGYSWYVFNVADAAIVAGVIGLLYDSFGPSRSGAANSP